MTYLPTEPEPRTNPYSLTRSDWEEFLAPFDSRSYRSHQVMKWIYHSRVTDVHQMSNLSKIVREKLAAITDFRVPEVISEQQSVDGTVKWVVRTFPGGAVECVLIPDGSRNTLCVSSQLGCSFDCEFCATGKQGFAGNLTVEDIVGQVVVVHDWLLLRPERGKISNIVFMGMGEPLMNFDTVMSACDIFMDNLAFGISKRRVTISTAGVVPRILDMCSRTEASLAVSLHAPNDALRNRLVPINRKYPIAVLLDACRRYLDSLHDRRIVTIEYTLIQDVNDSEDCARELGILLRDFRCKVNLIPFNPIRVGNLKRSPDNAIKNFYQILLSQGIMTTTRSTRGEDIDAACGQLVGTFNDKTQRRTRNYTRSLHVAEG